MNYLEARAYLDGLSRFGMKLGLSRMIDLLAAMGNPQNELRFVHIAGTNGKGSVATMLANTLTRSGYQTGLFVSPYIICFRERMQIDGEMISEYDFAACASFAIHCLEQLSGDIESPTQFELETAIAFEWYKRRGCAIVCLEVGLGGRFDSTNVIAAPLLQIITAISLDHTQVLGDTIEEIAFEKGGIIKGGCTILYPIQEAAARTVIARICEEQGSTLKSPSLEALEILNDHWLEGVFAYEGAVYHKSLPGRVQLYNCITMLAAAKTLQEKGFKITQAAMHHGIEQSRHPARLELLSKKPLVLLDGAHNPAGAQALADSLRQLNLRKLTLIMGLLSDKDEGRILQTLLPFATGLIALTPENPRALPAQQLCERARALGYAAECFDDARTAITAALCDLDVEDGLVVCGSLYLASQLRPILIECLSSDKGEHTHE